MPAYCESITIPTLDTQKLDKWTTKIVRLTNVDVNHISWNIDPYHEHRYLGFLDSYEKKNKIYH